MPKLLQALIVVSWISVAVVAPAAAETFLVKEGKPNAEIIIANDPPRSTRLAAHELQTSVEKISGAKLSITTKPGADVPVQIYVGASPHAEKLGITAEGLKHGAYRIMSGENRPFLHPQFPKLIRLGRFLQTGKEFESLVR